MTGMVSEGDDSWSGCWLQSQASGGLDPSQVTLGKFLPLSGCTVDQQWGLLDMGPEKYSGTSRSHP